MTETAVLIACGIDGEKQLLKALFMLCYIPQVLYSLQREHLKKCKINPEIKQFFSEDNFSKEENTITFCRLIDFSSNDQFDEKLKPLQPFWYARNLPVSEKPTFHEWFITGKVIHLPTVFILQYPSLAQAVFTLLATFGRKKMSIQKIKKQFFQDKLYF